MNFKRVVILLLVGILATSSLTACSQQPKEKVELLVSAAASLTDVLQELSEVYKTLEPGTTLTFTFGGSGALQTQIEEGAPVDIFISAAEKQMNALEEKELIVDNTRKTLLVNNVVLIVPSGSDVDIKSFEDLESDGVKKIAIGDPGNVPVGQYSEEIFANLNIVDGVNPKLVLANDVRTVLTWVESGEVDCGIVYETDAFTSDKIKVVTKSPEGSHKEVTYPAAVVKSSTNLDSSKKFLDFLSSDEAKKLFEKYGFTIK